MAASKSKLLLFHFRSARSLSSLSTLPLARVSQLLHNSNPPPHHHLQQSYPFAAYGFSLSRSIVTSPDHIQHTSIEDSILPVRVFASLLDGYHDLTGLPWWLTIVTSTLAMRFALLPLAVLQLQKLKMMGELSRKLPPPFPPLFLGRSYINHILHYRRERKAIGCPSLLWILAPYFIQVPCFFLCLTSIRRMSLDNHPGFDCGGTLWFQDLTETPYSLLNPIFPVLIAVLHNVNVQISFATSLQRVDSIFELLLKCYKRVLDLMSFLLLFIGFFMPQGSLVYWVTNGSFSLLQQLFFKHPAVVARFGLPNTRALRRGENSKEMHVSENLPAEPPSKECMITMEDLSPEELLKLSVIRLGREQHEKAISSLKLALEKDPDYMRAMVVLGNTLMQKEMLVEAREYLERAISKLSLAGHPIKVEEVDLLIQSSQWAALMCIKQGNEAEGLVHLERMATLQEPEDPQSKVHYYKGLLLLWSILHRANRREEAKKYASRMVAYDPSLRPLLEQLEKQGDVTIDLKVDY